MLWSVPSVWQSLAGCAVSCAHLVWTAAVFSAGWAEHFGVSCNAALRSHLLWMGLLHGAEWWMGPNGTWTGLHRAEWWMELNEGQTGPEQGSCMELILVPYDSAGHADHFDTCFVSLWPLVAIWMGLHRVWTGPHRAEQWMGLNEGQMGPKWGGHMGLILAPYDSAHPPDHFDVWLLYLQPLVAIWMGLYRAWTGPHGAEQWMGLNGDWMGPEWGSHTGQILVPMGSSHQMWPCLEWSSWLQVMLYLPCW